MKKCMVLLLGMMVSFSLLAQDKTTPVGTWKSVDDATGKPKSIVKIYEENGKLFGMIEKLFREPTQDQDPKCTKCEGENKDKPIRGMKILYNLSKDGEEWGGGEILDPGNGKTYRCKLTLTDNGSKLQVRGFLGISLFGRTQTWVRE